MVKRGVIYRGFYCCSEMGQFPDHLFTFNFLSFSIQSIGYWNWLKCIQPAAYGCLIRNWMILKLKLVCLHCVSTACKMRWNRNPENWSLLSLCEHGAVCTAAHPGAGGISCFWATNRRLCRRELMEFATAKLLQADSFRLSPNTECFCKYCFCLQRWVWDGKGQKNVRLCRSPFLLLYQQFCFQLFP